MSILRQFILNRLAVGLALGSVLSLGAVLITERVRADGIPQPTEFVYTGHLEKADGTPETAAQDISLALYADDTGGLPLCTVAVDALPIDNGRFQLKIPANCSAQVKLDPSIWVAVSVGGLPVGRTQLGVVPYAVEAETADEARNAHLLQGKTAAEFAPVEHPHGFADLQSIPNGLADGDDDTTYTAGTGLALSGQNQFSANTSYLQRRVTGTCDPGESVAEVAADGSVLCEVDDDTQYTAGTGLSLSVGNQFSVKTSDFLPGSWCSAGQALRGISGTTATCDTLPRMTVWQAFTPKLHADGNAVVDGINATLNTGAWRRVGDALEVMITTTFSSTIDDAKHVLWETPNGEVPVRPGSNSYAIGSAVAWKPGSIATTCVPEIETGTGAAVYVYCDGIEALRRDQLGPSAADWHTVSLKYSVPITGWTLTTPATP